MTMKSDVPCRILLVEDDPADANLVRLALRASSRVFPIELDWVGSLAEARQHCQQRLPDLMLLDLSLPDSQGLESLHSLRQWLVALPIIVLTGYDDNEFALQALAQGAQDYLVKGRFDDDGLVRTIRYALSRAALEARLHDSEMRMALALDGAKLGLWDMHVASGRMVFNVYWAQMLGYEPSELAPELSTWEGLVHPDDSARVKAALEPHLQGKTAQYESEYRLRHKDGHWVWIYSTGRVMERDSEGRAIRAVGIHQDISHRKQAEARDRLLVTALEAVSLGVILTDTEARIEWANPAFATLTGYTLEETEGQRPAELIKSGCQDSAFYEAMWKGIRSGKSWHGELINRRKNGELYHEELTIAPVPDENGIIQHFVGVKQDISERKRMEAELLEMATTDPLTGLYNRRYFMTRLEEELSRMQRYDSHQASVLMLDLDHFKLINDQYGHAIGDELLKHFAGLMRQEVRKIDRIGRMGGEEFAILMADTDLTAARSFAERLRQCLEQAPLQTGGQRIGITVSIGVAALNIGDVDPDGVLIRADQALYRSKACGRNQVRVFSAGL
ncbi:diguanylate cyclase [Methylomonas sp. LL1]|uniref:diguanylate cyclase n=1 Tax=Methylomonas sp. LL1 TaxID=2785785 RepID=UPI0018C39B97|nr:diguanylate cyclase [Methylomonas sp. LL1]QPK63188.1 diguanylate cyclase [Methylomonas sp. LL1]